MKGNARQDIGLLILRIGLGMTMIYFGSQKMLGVFGGRGYVDTVDMFHTKMGVPIVLAHLAIYGEFLGGLGVLAGCLTSIASIGVACTMAVATYMNLRGPGQFASIFNGAIGADPSKLFFPAILFAAALSLLVTGPGAYSIDGKYFRKSKR
ncbi:MAG: DoxX family protein [Fimbriimonas sp.]|nr:DoxX family protein [Fimbriimonas sp.]